MRRVARDAMRLALAVPQTLPDWRANLEAIETMSTAAAQAGTELVVFSEAALTGFVLSGDPAADLALGQTVPGSASTELSRIARERQLWLAAGMFEREGESLYDSALLFALDGSLHLRYRRIDPHWHPGSNRPPSAGPYAQGTTLEPVQTPLGKTSLLLCGDLFNATCQTLLADAQPQWLILPLARGFDEDVADTAQWVAEERYVYIRAAQKAGVGLILVNQLRKSEFQAYFGGAMVASKFGEILAEQPLERAGLLLVDLEAC